MWKEGEILNSVVLGVYGIIRVVLWLIFLGGSALLIVWLKKYFRKAEEKKMVKERLEFKELYNVQSMYDTQYSLTLFSKQQEITLERLFEIEKAIALGLDENSEETIRKIDENAYKTLLKLARDRKRMLKKDNIEERVLELVKWQTFILEKVSELNAKGAV